MDVGKGRMDRFRGEGLHARTPARTARPTRTGPSHPTPQPTPPPLDSSHFRRYCGVSKYCSTRASRAAPGPGPGPPPGGLRGSEVGGVEEGGWVG